MNTTKKNHKDKWVHLPKALTVVLVICIFFSACGKPDGEQQPTSPVESIPEETQTEEIAVKEGIISTPFGELIYPAQWQEYLIVEKTTVDPYTVSFSAKLEGRDKVSLFDVHFDALVGEPIGKIVTEYNVAVPVSVTIFPFNGDESWTQEEVAILQEMQEAVNDLARSLPFPEGENREDIVIDTPYTELRFPAKWEDRLYLEFVEGDPYIVEFYGKASGDVKMHLFSIRFAPMLDNSIGAVLTEDGTYMMVAVDFVNLEFRQGSAE